jgi:hypothetical protein
MILRNIFIVLGILIAVVSGVWVPKMNAQEASDWTKDLVKATCGDDYFDTPETVRVCEGLSPDDAAKIVGVLCLQF